METLANKLRSSAALLQAIESHSLAQLLEHINCSLQLWIPPFPRAMLISSIVHVSVILIGVNGDQGGTQRGQTKYSECYYIIVK